MRKSLLLTVLVSLITSAPVFATEAITDANSVYKLIGKIEKLSTGATFNLTFKSRIDETFQPTLVKVPDGYTKEKTWPLLVVLHGLGDGPIVVPSIDSMVQIGPFGRGDSWYKGVGEQDVFECVELARRIFNIAPDRIYLAGFSMGGGGTFELGLKYPDIWAACVPVCGTMGNPDLVSNGRNLPFWINAGSEDNVVPAKYSKRAYQKAIELGFENWKYTEYEGMGHSFWVDWEQIEKWLLAKKRINNPSAVSFTSSKPARAYWAQIVEKYNCKKSAKIEAEITSQIIDIETSNIADYTLYLKDAPVDISKEITVVENKNRIYQGKLSSEGIFNRKLDARKTGKGCRK